MAMARSTKYKIIGGTLLFGVIGFFILTSPQLWSLTHPGRTLPSLEGASLDNGRQIFIASDCSTCHQTPGQKNDTLLGGGRALETPFGIFHMPNISPDQDTGIGKWSLSEFDRALREGVGPDGRNLYPAFPYTSYQRLSGKDVRDMYAYIMSLKAVRNQVKNHELNFPFNLRRGIGLWRLAFLDGQQALSLDIPQDVDAAQYQRGAYLVEGAGHCAECHSPRSFMGNVWSSQRYGGGTNPEGTGYFPNISPSEVGIGFWSEQAISHYLRQGVSPIGRSADGDMAEVIKNTARLPRSDIEAMALYLKHLPPVNKAAPGIPEPNYSDSVVMLKSQVASNVKLPTSPAAEIKEGIEVNVAGIKQVWLTESSVDGSTSEHGKLLGGTPLQVIKRSGNKLELKLQGWQLADASSVIYQEKGHRIMQAILSDEAIATIKRGKPEKDNNTGQMWMPAEITVWTNDSNLNTNRADLWAYSRNTFQKACAACHVLPDIHHYTANQWIGTLGSMKRFVSLNDDQYRLILAYLQNHAKDIDVHNKVQK